MFKSFTLRRREIFSLNRSCSVLLSEKSVSTKLAKVLMRNKIAIRDIIEEADDQQRRFNKQKDELLIEHCKKDEAGKPIVEGRDYSGLMPGQCPEWDEASDDLQKEMEDYQKENVTVELTVIPDKLLKTGNQMEGIFPLLESEQKPDEKEDTED